MKAKLLHWEALIQECTVASLVDNNCRVFEAFGALLAIETLGS